ncbi:MAG: hypothetical protein ACI9VR_002600 [Cognaticolwellia sp.]|jgi:hypothetical protein
MSTRRTPALPQDRVSGYLRALGTALDQMGPNEDFVPLTESLAVLHALSPGLSGPLMAPAELSSMGMPAFAWLSRLHAEQVLALKTDPSGDTPQAEIDRAMALDPELGARVAGRRDLHRFLRGRGSQKAQGLLPSRRVFGALKRRKPALELRLYFDHVDAAGRWVRVVADLREPLRSGLSLSSNRVGPASLNREGRVVLEPGVLDLFMRHAAVPLDALHAQLSQAFGELTRLSRSAVGPFWFPSVALPAGIPADLGQGLALHLSTECVSLDIAASSSQDPMHPEVESGPGEMERYTGRRVACSKALMPAFTAWSQACGTRLEILAI